MIHWSSDDWTTATDVLSRPSGLGTHLVDLPTEQLPAGSNVVFTFYWTNAALWEGADYSVAVGT